MDRGQHRVEAVAVNHTSKTYDRRCERGHTFNTGDKAARYTTRKGNARYWCPACLAQGRVPPKDWRKA